MVESDDKDTEAPAREGVASPQGLHAQREDSHHIGPLLSVGEHTLL